MRIAVELRSVTLSESGGITILLHGLLNTLFLNHPHDRFVLFCTCFNRSLWQGVPDNVEVLTLPLKNFFLHLEKILKKQNVEVLFRCYPTEEALSFPVKRQIFLVPDVQHEVFPDFFDPQILSSRRRAFDHVLRQAGAIGTISNFARETIHAHCPEVCPDVFLISPALPREFQQALVEDLELSSSELARVPTGPFFLYPANLWPHKNHRRILSAFREFLRVEGPGMSFVFTGHPEGWEKLRAEFHDVPLHHLGFVSTQFLAWLYQRSKALIFFSLYEGFGIPLLEAFSTGTPVLCSNTSSLPEVGAEAVLSCDPTDVKSMTNLMVQMVENTAALAELIARGKKRLSHYSWDASAHNLRKACQRVAVRNFDPAIHFSDKGPPLVSIITPSFNQARFLKHTIESVLGQTYSRIEYIVVDGGSTDGSVEILHSYGDRFQWISEPDQGQSHAINKGFAMSHGQVRAYLNSDDWLFPEAVEKVVRYFQEHPGCDLVYGDANYIDDVGRVTGFFPTEDYSFTRLMYDCCICQPAAFWRTRIAQRAGDFNVKLQFAMDYEYWLRIARLGGDIHHSNEVLAASRLYPETKTMSSRGQIYDEIFQVCQAQGGYIHSNYFLGLWNYLALERREGWPRLLRYLRKTIPIVSFFHHKWHHRERYRNYSIGDLTQAVEDRLNAHFRSQGWWWRALLDALVPLRFLLNKKNPVRGFWLDNWLESRCLILLRKPNSRLRMRLAGVPVKDMSLTVIMEDKVVTRVQLQESRHEEIEFEVEVKRKFSVLQLKFSSYRVDSTRRQLSFQVLETNLFSERDTIRTSILLLFLQKVSNLIIKEGRQPAGPDRRKSF